jgi:hypothetical protein
MRGELPPPLEHWFDPGSAIEAFGDEITVQDRNLNQRCIEVAHKRGKEAEEKIRELREAEFRKERTREDLETEMDVWRERMSLAACQQQVRLRDFLSSSLAEGAA